MFVLVFCSVPGLHVAGKNHPAFAEYPVTEFTEPQLRELIADRHISVGIGHGLTADTVAAFIAEHNPPRAPVADAKATKTKGA